MFAGSTRVKSQSILDKWKGVRAAYSLRYLRSGIQAVVRVRRNIDNQEADFTPRQILDGSLVAFCGAGSGFIRTWYDQSGNNLHLEQSVATQQPLIVNNGVMEMIRGKPSIRLDGVDDFLLKTNANISVRQRMMFIVFKMNAQAYDARMFSIWDGVAKDFDKTSGYIFQMGNLLRSDEFGVFGSSGTSYQLFTGVRTTLTPHSLISESLSGTTGTLYKNGLSVASDNLFNQFDLNPTNNLYIGNAFNNAYASINTQEFIYYDSDRGSVRTQIEFDINDYYQIY